MKRPTQKDVARLAGVSRTTVSYVLNEVDEGHLPISEDTRRRVMEAIEELGYVPDARAQAFRSGSTKTIGLVLPDLRNPHFWEIAEGIEQSAIKAGYNLLLSNIALKHENANEIFRDLTQRRIDGLILVGSFSVDSEETWSYLKRFFKQHLPVVEMVDHRNVQYDVDRVASNYHDATVEAMSYLFELGHRRIGLVYGVPVHQLGEDRLNAYRESLEKAGVGIDEDLIVRCGTNVEDGHQAAIKLLNLTPRPTAIVAINDLLAIGVLSAINESGLRVPTDISVLSYDDIPIAKFLVPPLTTVSKDKMELSQRAMSLVLARIEDPSRPFHTEQFPARLIIRESIGPAPF
jgi:LacI family transcriptional regulator